MRDRRQPRAATFDKADAHLVVLPGGMNGGAPAPLAPGRDGRLNLDGAEAALGERLDHLLALPGEVGFIGPVLQLAAAAAAEMPAGGRLALGAGAKHFNQLCPPARDARTHLFAWERVGRVDRASFSLTG